ncbi:MAG: 30S ribosomal protein S6 [Verrucomicrobiota bacterium]|jgi:ribosomal protein S6|nr:30S ribosomal protein S6 [Verrucomicrobiota bacterium]
MKNNYLATIVFDPKGSDGSTDEMIPKLSEIIVSVDGEVQKVENQGSHDFAYPQKGKAKSGVYLQFDLSGDSEMPTRLKEKLRLEKKVDRVVVERK